MPLFNLLPSLPWPLLTVVMNILVGAGCLLVYALWVGNTIFSIAMGGVAIASSIELVGILLGRHHHTDNK